MVNTFDVGVIGMGVAGSFAIFKLSKEQKSAKIIGFDIGRPPMKRRRQLEGWLGCLPNSDGKLYQQDINKLSLLTGLRKAKSSYTQFKHILEHVDDCKVIKDKSPSINVDKKLKKLGYEIMLNDYIQLYPKEIHALSKYMAESIENNKNITFCFDDEVFSITKQKNLFVINTENNTYYCKKIIIATGRSGWRWTNDLYSKFGIVDSNDVARFGIRVETNSNIMKEFNKSNCTIFKKDLEIGPLNWYGTVIPEDHVDMAISAFRSNENRWKTDKVSFSLIGSREFLSQGFEQTNRIGQLTFVLSNDRIIKEKISTFLNDKSTISLLSKDYNWLKNTIMELSGIIPEIITKAYFHIPTIVPTISKINIGNNLESEIDNMFVVGEAAGVSGILSAACMGITVVDSILK